MTEEQFTDEQGNIVTKKVGTESPLSWGEAGEAKAKRQAAHFPPWWLPSPRGKHGSDRSVGCQELLSSVIWT